MNRRNIVKRSWTTSMMSGAIVCKAEVLSPLLSNSLAGRQMTQLVILRPM